MGARPFEGVGFRGERVEPKPGDGLSARLVKARVELALLVAASEAGESRVDEAKGKYLDGAAVTLRCEPLDWLHQHVATMERANILVRRRLRTVEEFSERARWERLSEADALQVGEELASLPNGMPPEDVLAKGFDLLCFKLEVSLLSDGRGFEALRDKIRDYAELLAEKQNVPMVAEHMELIEEIQAEAWWTDVTLPMVELVRRRLRGLIQFIDLKRRPPIETNFDDEMGEAVDHEVPIVQTGFSRHQYRKKVERFIRDHETHVVIAKLKRNQALTPTDLDSLETMLFSAPEVESRERFELVFGKDQPLALFIRKLVGLDRAAAKAAFSVYLDRAGLGANQIRFIETIIDHLTQNGVMDPGLLYEPPFTDLHFEGLDGVFPAPTDADNIVSIVRSFSEGVQGEARRA